jgi:hypothetical protein
LASCIDRPCRWQFSYPVIDGLGVVAAGLLAAGVIIAVGTVMRRHVGDDDNVQLDPGLGAGATWRLPAWTSSAASRIAPGCGMWS